MSLLPFLLHTFTIDLLDINICLCNNTHNKEQNFIKGSKMFEMTYTKPQIASLMNIRIETYEEWVKEDYRKIEQFKKELEETNNELIKDFLTNQINSYEQAIHDRMIAVNELKSMKYLLTHD